MPAFPHHFDSSSLYPHPAASPSTSQRELTVTCGGTVHTKGSWVEICSSLEVDCCGVLVHCSTFSERVMWDLGIGGSGYEQVVLPNAHGCNQDLYRPNLNFYPITLPKGARVAIRTQSNSASTDSYWTFYFVPANFGFPGFGRAIDVGADTSYSAGQNVDPGGTAHTKSSYVELTSSLDIDAKWIMLLTTHGVGGSYNDTSWLIDLATGTSGNEQVILPDLYMFLNEFGNSYYYARHWGPKVFSMPFSIPQGSRIATRAQSSSITDTDRDIYIHLLAFG